MVNLAGAFEQAKVDSNMFASGAQSYKTLRRLFMCLAPIIARWN